MIDLERFKSTITGAGNLMQAGSDEAPDTELLGRIAQNLGISAASVAASVGTGAAIAEVAAAHATSKVAVSASLAGSKPFGSWLLTAAVKGVFVGLGTTALVVSAVRVRSLVHPPPTRQVSVAVTAPQPLTAKGAINPSVVAERLSEPVLQKNSQGASAVPSLASARAARATQAPEIVEQASPLSAETQHNETSDLTGHDSTATPPSANGGPSPERTIDPRLSREVASLDRARTLLKSGSAGGALGELGAFEQSVGYQILRREALLVKIDVLQALGHRLEARAVAAECLRVSQTPLQRERLQEFLRIRHLIE